MKILFLDPPGYQHQGYNLGLAMLCSALARHGHQTLVFDRNESGDMERVVQSFQPHVVGVSVKSATYTAGVRLAEQARALHPRALVLAGGPHPTINPADMLRDSTAVDLVLAGEAEHAIVELTARLDALGGGKHNGELTDRELLAEAAGDIGGVAYRRDGEVVTSPARLVPDLDELAFPRLESFVNVDAGSRPYHMMTSRGCPFRCAYCSVRSIAGRKLRTRSVESVIEELLYAKACYGIEVFEVDDDNFTLQIDRAKAICEALLQRRVGLPWYLPNGIRAEMLDRELTDLLARSSCHTVALGIETADPKVLRTIHKGQTPEVVERAVSMLHDAGVRVMGFFIIGLPGSDLQSDLGTIAFERNLALDDRIYNAFVPYPCTEGYAWARENGRFLADYRDALHFSDREDTVFETDAYPAAQRKAALTLARLGTDKLRHEDFALLKELVLSGLDRDALVVEAETYCPGISETLRRFAPLTTVQVRDRTAGDVRCVEPDGKVSLTLPLAAGWQHDLSLATALLRALAGRRFGIVVVPKIHSYLALSLLCRADHRFQYTFQRELSSTSPREIMVESPVTFVRGRLQGAARLSVPDPVRGVERGFRALAAVRELGSRLRDVRARAEHLPAWLREVPTTAAVAATSQLGVRLLRLRRRAAERRS